MTPQTLLLTLLVCCLALPIAAQQTEAEYLLEASRAVDPYRYKDVRGTPYRYKTFREGKLYDATMNEYTVDSLNYNGFTSQFEYQIEGEIREVAGQNFLRGSLTDDDGTEHIYGWRINPKFQDKYAELVYRGDFVTATMIYSVINDEKVVQDVGKTVKLRRFSAKSLYFALVDGELVPLRLSAKALAEDLGHKSELSKFIKANKLKPGKREDLVKIFEKAESLF